MEMPSQSVTGRNKGHCSGPGEVLELCDSIGDVTEDTGNKIMDPAAMGNSPEIFLVKAESTE